MKDNVKYELNKLEDVVARLLDKNEKKATRDDRTAIEKSLTSEVETVRKKLTHEVFSFQDERHLERYIQFHQQELIRIADQLNVAITTTKDTHQTETLQRAMKKIEALLEFVQRHFTRYFDQDTKAPENYIALCGTEVMRKTNDIRTRLKELQVDADVISLVMHPLTKFINDMAANRITYRNILYVRDAAKEITRVLTGNTATMPIDEIHHVLVYLNYNTLKTFQYLTNGITKSIHPLESATEKVERLSWHRKGINQLPVKPGAGYNRQVPSLKEQLTAWIEEEILYLEKSNQLSEHHNTPAKQLPEEFKIKTELSVAQLAFLVRVLLETKCILNNNTSDLIRFFSRYVQTKRLENISYESFRVRFYNTEESAKRTVRGLLLQWVDYINASSIQVRKPR